MVLPPRLPPSLDLIHRVTETATAYTLARMKILESIPNNPIGIAWRIEENIVALMARHLPSPNFNSVIGLRKGQADRIRPLIDWYRAHDLPGRFAIAAGDDDPALGRELSQNGFFQSAHHATLIGEPNPGAAEAIAVEPVMSAEDMEKFLQAYVAGWGIPPAAQEQFKRNVRPWHGQPGWLLYLARVNGQAAAAAILFLHQRTGYLADSATDPAFRGRGLHTALLTRRLADATAAGVDFICSGAAFLSQSHRNMERVGMRLLFLQSIWTTRD